MSTPQTTVETDLRAAMKAGDKERVATLRMLLSEVKNERIRRGPEVDEAAFVGRVRKAIKQRHEASEQFTKGDRPELAAKEEREAAILEANARDMAAGQENGLTVAMLDRRPDAKPVNNAYTRRLQLYRAHCVPNRRNLGEITAFEALRRPPGPDFRVS